MAGDGVHEAMEGGAGADTVIAVHAPQLLVSSLSVIAPTSPEEFLSAHTRRYLVVPASPAGNVYEIAAGVDAEPLSELSETVPTSLEPVPELSFAF